MIAQHYDFLRSHKIFMERGSHLWYNVIVSLGSLFIKERREQYERKA